VRCEKRRPSGTAKYSRVYMACQRNRTSENVCGQYFAAPSRSSPTSKATAEIPRDFAVANRRDATQCKTIVAAHRCLPRLRRKREAKHQ
jgi:hypothetical protein